MPAAENNLRCFQNLRLKACSLAVVLHLRDLRPSERSGFATPEKLQNERKLFASDGVKKSATNFYAAQTLTNFLSK